MNSLQKIKALIKQSRQKSIKTWEISKTKNVIISSYRNAEEKGNDELYALYFNSAEDLFYIAVTSGLTDVARNLIDDNAVDINGKYFSDGQTALHTAVIQNNFDLLLLLLQHGADLNIKDNKGYTVKEYQKMMHNEKNLADRENTLLNKNTGIK